MKGGMQWGRWWREQWGTGNRGQVVEGKNCGGSGGGMQLADCLLWPQAPVPFFPYLIPPLSLFCATSDTCNLGSLPPSSHLPPTLPSLYPLPALPRPPYVSFGPIRPCPPCTLGHWAWPHPSPVAAVWIQAEAVLCDPDCSKDREPASIREKVRGNVAGRREKWHGWGKTGCGKSPPLQVRSNRGGRGVVSSCSSGPGPNPRPGAGATAAAFPMPPHIQL